MICIVREMRQYSKICFLWDSLEKAKLTPLVSSTVRTPVSVRTSRNWHHQQDGLRPRLHRMREKERKSHLSVLISPQKTFLLINGSLLREIYSSTYLQSYWWTYFYVVPCLLVRRRMSSESCLTEGGFSRILLKLNICRRTKAEYPQLWLQHSTSCRIFGSLSQNVPKACFSLH